MRMRIGFLGGALILAASCDGRVSTSEPVEPAFDAQLRQEIARWGVVPIGEMPAQDARMVELGRALFFDKVLSGNRDVSCATCHDPAAALGDGRALPVGTGAAAAGAARRPGNGRSFVPRHAPSLLNSGVGSFYMFWDGRLAGFGHGGGFNNETGIPLPGGLSHPLIAQAMLPVLNRQEMRGQPGDVDVFGNTNELASIADTDAFNTWNAIMKRLLSIPGYVQLFAAAYPGRSQASLRFEDAARAIAVFQMQELTKTKSRFDRYLDRDDAALTAEEKRGASLFFGTARCGSCHSGPLLGAQGFANVGAPQIGPGAGRRAPLDLGRGEIQNHEFYQFAFRVAPLRNVELTAPYMHSGAYPTLEAVVRHYNDVPAAARAYDPTHLDPDLRALVHTDEAAVSEVLATLDGRLRSPLNLTEAEQRELIAFLKSLTDPTARDLRSLTPAAVPSGLPVH